MNEYVSEALSDLSFQCFEHSVWPVQKPGRE